MVNGLSFRSRFQYGASVLSRKLFSKARLVLRAIYASTTSAAARSLAHQLDEENKLTRELRRENTRLVTAIQAFKRGDVVDGSHEIQELRNTLLDYKKKNDFQRNTIDQLMAERSDIRGSSGVVLKANTRRLMAKNKKLSRQIKELSYQSGDPASSDAYRVKFIQSYGAAPLFFALESALFANARKITLNEKFTHVISHDVLGASAALSLARIFGAEYWLDLVEDIRLHERTGEYYRNKMTETDIAMLNSFIKSSVVSADTLLSIGPWQQGKNLTISNQKCTLLPNYRDPFISSESIRNLAYKTLRENGVSEPYICIPNRIRSVREVATFIEALVAHGKSYALVHIGPETDAPLLHDIQEVLKNTGFKFSQLGFCEYDVYRQILSEAEFAIIANFNPAINAKYAYPNRLFDCVSSGCPILTTGFVQVSEFVTEHSVGVGLDADVDAQAFKERVGHFLKSRATFTANLKVLKTQLTWKQYAAKAFTSIGENSNVLIMSRKNLEKNIRVQQMRSVLEAKKCKVTVIGGDPNYYKAKEGVYTVPLTRLLSSDELFL